MWVPVLYGGAATLYCEATDALATLRRVRRCVWRLVSQRQPREKVPASQTCAHRRHATRPRDLRASPRAANGTRPSVLIHPTSLTSSAASKKLGLPSLTGSAEQALFAYCESMCSEGAGEFLHSEHMRQRPGARSRCAAQWTMPGQAILTARSGAPPTSCTAVASMAAWSALNVA